MSLLGTISHSFETIAESITGSPESAPEVYGRRVGELRKAAHGAAHLPTIDIPKQSVTQQLLEQTPTSPLNTVDYVPAQPQPEIAAPVAFTDETFTTAVPTDGSLDANRIRAQLESIRFAQMDAQALVEMADRSQN